MPRIHRMRGPLPARIERLPDGVAAPLSFNQERELYRHWWARAHGYQPLSLNMPVRFAFEAPVNRPALERALNEIIRRHDGLRMGFAPIGGAMSWKLVRPLGALAIKWHVMRRAAAWTMV